MYDVPRNFLGDMHWTEGGELQEGDEIDLDKGGIMVQVAEQVGRTETDISELRVQKRDRSSPAKAFSSSPMPSHVPRTVQRIQGSAAPPQMKHKSLNALLGSARGQIGKAALPTQSPFDLKIKDQENTDWQSSRKPKRQRTDAWTIEMTTRTPRPSHPGAVPSTTVSRQKNQKTSARKGPNASDRSQRTLDVKQVIDISSDTEDAINEDESRDHFASSSPACLANKRAITDQARPQVSASVASYVTMREKHSTEHDISTDSPSIQHAQRRQMPASIALPVSPSCTTSGPVSPSKNSRDVTSSKAAKTVQLPEPQASPCFSTDADSQKRGKPLKLVGSAPRKMLVFQGQPSSRDKSRQREKARPESAPEAPIPLKKAPQLESQREAATKTSQHLRLQERLARIEKREKERKRSPSQPHAMQPEQCAQGVTEDVEMADLDAVVTPREMDTVDGDQHFATPSAVLRALPAPKVNDGQMKPPQSLPFGSRNKVNKQRTKYNLTDAADPLTSTLLAKPFKPPSARAEEPTAKATVDVQTTANRPENRDLGPWSAEAFDLMDWRPPDRGAEGNEMDQNA